MGEALSAIFTVMGDPNILLLILVTTIGGVIIGALPGLGATTGAALLLPFTLTMEPVAAITVLTTIYVSATFAGAITAALFLQEFVAKDVPWAHIDTFAWVPTALPGRPVGGEALGLRAAFEYLRTRYTSR